MGLTDATREASEETSSCIFAVAFHVASVFLEESGQSCCTCERCQAGSGSREKLLPELLVAEVVLCARRILLVGCLVERVEKALLLLELLALETKEVMAE